MQEVLNTYEILRREFPSARLHASEIGDFVHDVVTYGAKLPTVTGEMGDTWIPGISSDPKKEAEYRVVTDTLTECIKMGKHEG